MEYNENKTKRLNLTILERDYNEIQNLISQNKYLSASEFVREAIREHLYKNKK